MSNILSFEPLGDPSARVLILGSMPGEASLRANQYYAHHQNAFWKIMAELTGVSHRAPYVERIAGLNAGGFALWDVLKSCTRQGSLDSSIIRNTVKANDFAGFFSRHQSIELICFNGAVAENEYIRHILPLNLQMHARRIRLPSTSPAYAAMAFQEKLAAWCEAVSFG